MRRVLIAVVVVFILIQLVPLDRGNPPAAAPIEAPPEVRRVLEASCFDCHSHATRWPWYAWVAPVSFLVVHDVDEAREHLNFSTWEAYPADERRELAEEIVEETREGEMPLPMYTFMHRDARLSPGDEAVLEGYFGAMAEGADAASPPPAAPDPEPTGGDASSRRREAAVGRRRASL
jgi:hypothetical protein